jgi:hypothetical protein
MTPELAVLVGIPASGTSSLYDANAALPLRMPPLLLVALVAGLLSFLVPEPEDFEHAVMLRLTLRFVASCLVVWAFMQRNR